MELLHDAIQYATTAHLDQRDKGGFPYILHPLRVMGSLVSDFGFDPASDEAYLAAAVLHDVVEDTENTLDDIQWEFNSRVRDIVDVLSRRYDVKETHKQYIERLCSCSDVKILKIKLADTLDNQAAWRSRYVVPSDYGMAKRYIEQYNKVMDAIQDLED